MHEFAKDIIIITTMELLIIVLIVDFMVHGCKIMCMLRGNIINLPPLLAFYCFSFDFAYYHICNIFFQFLILFPPNITLRLGLYEMFCQLKKHAFIFINLQYFSHSMFGSI